MNLMQVLALLAILLLLVLPDHRNKAGSKKTNKTKKEN